jgi:hypothetical protein
MDRTQSYAKVKTRIKGYARICESANEQPLFRGFSGPAKHPADDLDSSKVPEWLKVYVLEMDRKLDMLLGMQSKKEISSDFPILLEVVEVSGNSILFKTESRIDTPSHLEVVLEVEKIPLRLAGAIGTVSPAKRKNYWIMDFDNIREHDLELIIQFVFSEQREQIRTGRVG